MTASTRTGVHELLRDRWSPRAFSNAPVPAEDLQSLLEAAQWAASSMNEQPWRFVMASRHRSRAAFDALLASLTEKNRAWAQWAPVLVLVAVRSTLERSGAANAHAFYDAGQAVAFFTLQATAAGLSTRQMQGFHVEEARVACEVPQPFEPAVVIAVGRAGDPESLTEPSHRAAEQQPRERRGIAEFVFEGTWGQPLGLS